MNFDHYYRRKTRAQRWCAGAVAGVVAVTCIGTPAAAADPAQDAVAQLGELSRQAEQLTESMHAAQLDLDTKVRVQNETQAAHGNDIAALEAANLRLASFQEAVNTLAASVYMGGRTDGMNAILTASSPQGLIDKMAVQKVMGTEMAAQMSGFRRFTEEALAIGAASAKSAADATIAADEAAAVRADLQRRQSQLQVKIAAVKSRYETLAPVQRAFLAAPAVPPPAVVAAPAPESGPSSDVMALAAVPPPSVGSSAGATAVQAALTRVGSPYAWGGGGPSSFDCSGLVQWAFQQAGVFLPHSSYALAAGGQSVATNQMQPGDVVTQYSDASHVGIYVGDGLMVHASTYGIPVRVESVYNSPIYNVRRY